MLENPADRSRASDRPTGGRRLASLLASVVGFAAVSGVGLGLDFGIFLLLVHAGTAPAVANLASATAAVTFVYFASVSRIFSYRGRFLLPLFFAYLLYQAIAVVLASYAVGALATLLPSAALAKLAVLPATFSMNYLVMRRLTRRPGADAARPAPAP